MPPTNSLSRSQARRIGLAAQGFNDTAPTGKVDRRHLRRVMGRLQLLQLDSVPVLMRTQYLPLFSRLGPYRAGLLDEIAYGDDEWFEAWSHEASLLPVDTEPLLRWHKQRCLDGEMWGHLTELAGTEGAYIDEVYAEVADRGPLLAKELSDPRPQDGEWWGSRSMGTRALDVLFRFGKVGIRRVGNFEKEFDLLENIIPAEILAQPTPTEEDAHRELLRRAAVAHGVGTAECLADYFRLPIRSSRARLAELVEAGEVEEVTIEGWSKPAFRHTDAKLPRWVKGRALLSPFDPVVWNRDRASALFDFDYRIEIYTPADKRIYGYYVLPFLLDEHLVGRIDLKTNRKDKVLEVKAAFAESGVDRDRVAAEMHAELTDLAQLVGAEDLTFGERGDLTQAVATHH